MAYGTSGHQEWLKIPKGREGVLFVLAVLGFIHEIAITDGERPYLLLALCALAGLPVTQYLDRLRRAKGGTDE